MKTLKIFSMLFVIIISLFSLSSCGKEDLADTTTYSNHDFGYQLDYPVIWFNLTSSSNSEYASFVIKNTKDALEPGSDFVIHTDASLLKVGVYNNMNYSSYEEFIKNSGLSASLIKERIDNLVTMNIGGKTLQVFPGIKTSDDNGNSRLYSFVYNKRLYSIDYQSGSNNQFIKDKKIFDDIISSFKFIE